MVSIYYDGTMYHTPAPPCSNHENLHAGQGTNVGSWGAKARRTFIARAAYLADRSQYRCKIFILTYREGHIPTGPESKKQINTFLQVLRRQGMDGYLYAAEFGDKKGLLHYHFLAGIPWMPVDQVNDAWARIRGDQAPNAVRAFQQLRSVNGAAGYGSKAAAYASKTAGKLGAHGLPKDMRIWASSHNLVGKEKIVIHDSNMINHALVRSQSMRRRVLENGIEIETHMLAKDDVREIWHMHEVFTERTQREIRDKAPKPPKSTQIVLPI